MPTGTTVNGGLPRIKVSLGIIGARDTPTIASNKDYATNGRCCDGGILTRFTSYTTVSSLPCTATPHIPSSPLLGSRHKEAPPPTGSFFTNEEDNQQRRRPPRCVAGSMATHTHTHRTETPLSRSASAAMPPSHDKGMAHHNHPPSRARGFVWLGSGDRGRGTGGGKAAGREEEEVKRNFFGQCQRRGWLENSDINVYFRSPLLFQEFS
jgi:hypothetical protein